MEAHRGELADAVTRIIQTAVGVIGDVISSLFSKENWDNLSGIEKAIMGLAAIKVGDGILHLTSHLKDLFGLFGSGGGVSQVINTMSTLKEHISLLAGEAGGLSFLGPLAVVLAGLGWAIVDTHKQTEQFLNEAGEGLDDSLDGAVEKVKRLQDAQQGAQDAFNNLSDSGAIEGLTMAQEELDARTVALNAGYEELAKKLNISTDELKNQMDAVDGDITKIKALKDAQDKLNDTPQYKNEADEVRAEKFAMKKPVKTKTEDPTRGRGHESYTRNEVVNVKVTEQGSAETSMKIEAVSGSIDDLQNKSNNLDISDTITNIGDAGNAAEDAADGFSSFVSSLVGGVDLSGEVGGSIDDIKSKLTTAFESTQLGGLIDWSQLFSGMSDIDITSMFTGFGGQISAEATELGSAIPEGAQQGIDGSSGLATSAIDILVDALIGAGRNGLQSNSPSLVFDEIGRGVPEGLQQGINSNTGLATSAANAMVSKVSAKGNGLYSKFYTIGSNLVNGLVNGITSKLAAAYSAGARVAEEAERGAKDASKEASPSKVFMQIGEYMSQGLAIGIDNDADEAVTSVVVLSDALMNAMSSTMAKVAVLANDDFDISPVITPVVDLANVDSAVNTVSGLLGRSYNNTMTTRMSALSNNMQNLQASRTASVGNVGSAGSSTSNVINLYIDGIKYNTDDYIDNSINSFVETIVRKQKMYAGG